MLDIAFPGEKIGVCIDGCFWHGCPAHYVFPRTRRDFWSKKLRENVERDRRQTLKLESQGWRIFRFWEHEVFENVAGIRDLVISARRDRYIRQGRVWKVVAVEILNQANDTERRHLETLRCPILSKAEERKRTTTKWDRSSRPRTRADERSYAKSTSI
jgi:DNA mismatch endonuclease (patch repair protein)